MKSTEVNIIKKYTNFLDISFKLRRHPNGSLESVQHFPNRSHAPTNSLHKIKCNHFRHGGWTSYHRCIPAQIWRTSCQSYKAQTGRRLVGVELPNPELSPAAAEIGPPCKQLLLKDEVM